MSNPRLLSRLSVSQLSEIILSVHLLQIQLITLSSACYEIFGIPRYIKLYLLVNHHQFYSQMFDDLFFHPKWKDKFTSFLVNKLAYNCGKMLVLVAIILIIMIIQTS